FLSGGSFQHARFHYSRAVGPSRAWDSTISERWTTPARGILRFLGGGPFQRVRFPDSRVLDPSSAQDSAILGRWTLPARKISLFLSGGLLPRVGIPRFLSDRPFLRVGFCDFWAVDYLSTQICV